MDQQVSPENEFQSKSKLPLVALILSLSSGIFCCISFAIGFIAEDFIINSPMVLFAETVLCAGAIAPFVGMIAGGIALTDKDINKTMAIAAILIGIIAVLAAVLVMFFLFFFFIAVKLS